jgi:hypothetical protein
VMVARLHQLLAEPFASDLLRTLQQ